MECMVCKTRSAVGNCGTCRALLCEVCGARCQGCGKGMCPQHRQRTDGGRWLCPECMAARNVRRLARGQDAPEPAGVAATPAPRSAPPQQSSPSPPVSSGGGTGFADLIADLGDQPLIRPVDVPEREAPAPTSHSAATVVRGDAAPAGSQAWRAPGGVKAAAAAETDLDEIERRAAEMLARSMEEDEKGLNKRVLTGSAHRGTPMWVSSLFIGGMACLFLLFVVGKKEPAFKPMYDLMHYAVIFIGMAAVAWAGYGFFRPNQTKLERNLCVIGLLLGMIAVFVALIN